MIRGGFMKWVQAPPVTGWMALLCGLAAIWLPTIVRASVNGSVAGCEFTPYLPFVLICAILLRWWQAGVVALASVAILGGLFGGSAHLDFQCFASAAGIFLGASAMLIAIALLVRRSLQERGADHSSGGLVFSLDKGEVWASWRGQSSPVRLGSQRRVTETMESFLANAEPGKSTN